MIVNVEYVDNIVPLDAAIQLFLVFLQ